MPAEMMKATRACVGAGAGARARPFRVSIEGNIGSGKSTCIAHLARLPRVETHPEPLHEWRDVRGHNLLALLYSDMKRWNFTFQHHVHLTRLRLQTAPPARPDTAVQIFERSVQNSRCCFVENARAQRLLSEPEYRVLDHWFDFTERHLDISLDLIVYLRSSPGVVWERVLSRARREEAEVSLEYLESVHAAHERWLGERSTWPARAGCRVVTLDADRDLRAVLADLDDLAPRVLPTES